MAVKKARILVVDDEYTIAQSIAEVLEWEGYDVVTAPNGKRALEELSRSAFDLVLLDFMMPVLDGQETLRRIRATPPIAETKVVMVTAVPISRLQSPPLYDAYLAKPFELDDLLSVVSRFVAPAGSPSEG